MAAADQATEPGRTGEPGRAGEPGDAGEPGADGPQWLAWLREVHAIAAAGRMYAENAFDTDRYTKLSSLASTMIRSLAEHAPPAVAVMLDAEIGYVTPKLDVRAAVHDERGRILLVREVSDGHWSLPGGWADVNESLAEGAVREVYEESGYVVEVDRLLGIYERERWGHPPMPFFTLKAVLGCRLVGGTATPSIETLDVDWFARDALPPLSVGRTSGLLMDRVFDHHADPTLPSDLS